VFGLSLHVENPSTVTSYKIIRLSTIPARGMEKTSRRWRSKWTWQDTQKRVLLGRALWHSVHLSMKIFAMGDYDRDNSARSVYRKLFSCSVIEPTSVIELSFAAPEPLFTLLCANELLYRRLQVIFENSHILSGRDVVCFRTSSGVFGLTLGHPRRIVRR